MTKTSDFSTLSFRQKATKILFFAFIGHFLELYDYTLYVVMLSITSQYFFTSDFIGDPVSFGLLMFGVSLLIAPPGSWFWGWYGDRFGRLPMLRQSIMLMAFPSLVIALLPTYQEAGIIAPILLISCRFVQTFSASGEVNGAKIFAMEHLGTSNLGRVSGLLSAAGGLGVLLAMGMGFILSSTGISWRIPFLLGSSLAVVGVMIRRKVSESPEFVKMLQKNPKRSLGMGGTIAMIRQNKNAAMTVSVLGALLGVLSYTMHAFLNPFITSLGFASATAYKMGVVGLVSCGVAALITGVVIDKLYQAKKVMNANIVACIVIMPISFWMILQSTASFQLLLYAAFILQGALLGMNAACCTVIMFSLFSPESRCRGVMICYAFGMAIFGGFTPYVLKLSTKLDNFAPAVIVTLLSVAAYFVFRYNMRRAEENS